MLTRQAWLEQPGGSACQLALRALLLCDGARYAEGNTRQACLELIDPSGIIRTDSRGKERCGVSLVPSRIVVTRIDALRTQAAICV